MSRVVNKQKGFTIIELMIATAVFTTILMVVLVSVTQIGNMYYKGITSAKTQEITRTVVERVSQEVQFMSKEGELYKVSRTNGAITEHLYCVGNARFFFILNKQYDGTGYGLWTDDSATSEVLPNICTNSVAFETAGNPNNFAVSKNGRNLLSKYMRVTKFDVVYQPGSGLYTVTVRVAYGDDELLEGDPVEPTCKSNFAGSQFCAVSELSSALGRRID